MKIGERGQVTIPKPIRDQFGLEADSEVEFTVSRGEIVLRKAPKKLDIARWKGHCRKELGDSTVDQFIADIRGR